eukprot:2501167-Amphidinium_carterae.1
MRQGQVASTREGMVPSPPRCRGLIGRVGVEVIVAHGVAARLFVFARPVPLTSVRGGCVLSCHVPVLSGQAPPFFSVAVLVLVSSFDCCESECLV